MSQSAISAINAQTTIEQEKPLSGRQVLLVFLCLLAVEAFTFGPLLPAIGVYLDEWTTFGSLHFVNQSLPSLIDYLMHEPRQLVRPIEPPYFAILYYFLKERPFGYHLVIVTFEVASAWFLYLSLARLTKSQKTSLAAAALFLVFPSHDTTHYSIISSSIPMSLAFYTLCLWQFIKGIEEEKMSWIIYSGVSFFISVFNYELCLPLFVVNAACGVAVMWGKYSPAKVFALSVLYQIPLAFTALSMILYRTLILPALKLGWHYTMLINPHHFIYVICQGIKVSISPFALSFYSNLVQQKLMSMTHSDYVLIMMTIMALTSTFLLLPEGKPRRYSNALLIGIGILTLFSAYTIYAVSAEYIPVLETNNNRVNSASSIGVCMILAGLIGCLVTFFRIKAARPTALIFSLFVCPVIAFCMLTDWEYAKPWVVSWRVQKIITKLVKSNAHRFQDGDSIILANIPRFVMWCPVYNGMWDFEPTVRIALNNNRIKAGVVSDRMTVTQDGVIDHVGKHICARYPYKRMFVMVPSPLQFIPIHSKEEFLACMDKYGNISGFDSKSANEPIIPW